VVYLKLWVKGWLFHCKYGLKTLLWTKRTNISTPLKYHLSQYRMFFSFQNKCTQFKIHSTLLLSHCVMSQEIVYKCDTMEINEYKKDSKLSSWLLKLAIPSTSFMSLLPTTLPIQCYRTPWHHMCFRHLGYDIKDILMNLVLDFLHFANIAI